MEMHFSKHFLKILETCSRTQSPSQSGHKREWFNDVSPISP